MKKLYQIASICIVLILVFIITIAIFNNQTSNELAPTYTYQVIKTYPHDVNAFTEGLVFDGGFLYESTGLNGSSTIRRVELDTGNVLKIRSLRDLYFGEGAAIIDNKIIQLTWKSHVGFVYDKQSFEVISEFSYPTEGWGLTYDGSKLIMSDGSSKLYFLNPDTFERIGEITVFDNQPISLLNELEYIKGKIYANIFGQDRIAIIDPKSGKVEAWIHLSDLPHPNDSNINKVLNGIAYDPIGDRIFVTGKMWPTIFEIQIFPNN